MDSISPEIIIITEHGLTENNLKTCNLQNYNLISSFSRQQNKWGGVALYVREDSAIEEIEINNVAKELVFETAIIKIRINKVNLVLIGLYRPPTANTDEFFSILDNLLQTFSKVKKKQNYCYGRL